jgi:hypothetical protein
MHELLLPFIAHEARNVRVLAGLSYAHIAIRVLKRDGRRGVSESTISRFEAGQHWPENPDAVVVAYADATGLPPWELWAAAAEACLKANQGSTLGEIRAARLMS